jgi:uncharacterized protein YfkK (UPF0435 family)
MLPRHTNSTLTIVSTPFSYYKHYIQAFSFKKTLFLVKEFDNTVFFLSKHVTMRKKLGRMNIVDLSVKSPENITFMIDQISEKLRMLNIGAIKGDAFDEEMYEDLKYLYEMVMRKDSFSPSEMQAIAEELGALRKQA